MDKKTYKDYNIGDIAICYSIDREFDSMSGVPDKEFWEQHLTPGKKYKVDDVDWHFPNKIAVKCDGGISMFVPIEFFIPNTAEIRNEKINTILDEKDNC